MCADSHAQWGLVQHVRVNEIAAPARALRCAVLLHGTYMHVHLHVCVYVVVYVMNVFVCIYI